MKISRAQTSLLLFGVSLLVWAGLTLFEAAFVGMSTAVERVITLLTLVLLPGLGSVIGALGLVRRESPTWLALVGTVLNFFLAFFHLLIVLFAG